MSTFFKEIAETMGDRQELRLNITKIGTDLVILAVPNFKDEGKHITISGSPEDLDLGFIEEIKKPLSVKAEKLISNADSVSTEEEEEEEEEEGKDNPPVTKKASGKGKTAMKKDKNKKPGDKVEAPVPEVKVEDKPEVKDNEFTDTQEMILGKDKKEFTITMTADAPEEKKEETPVLINENPQQTNTPVVEPEVKEELKEEEEEGPSKDELFEFFMAEGKQAFADRKYNEAEDAYTKAVELKPDDKKAKSDLDQASKWVRAIAKLNSKEA